jgi:hypothetical protein
LGSRSTTLERIFKDEKNEKRKTKNKGVARSNRTFDGAMPPKLNTTMSARDRSGIAISPGSVPILPIAIRRLPCLSRVSDQVMDGWMLFVRDVALLLFGRNRSTYLDGEIRGTYHVWYGSTICIMQMNKRRSSFGHPKKFAHSIPWKGAFPPFSCLCTQVPRYCTFDMYVVCVCRIRQASCHCSKKRLAAHAAALVHFT